MPLDAICLRAVTNELNNVLAGCRVEKVYQPDRDEIVLQTRGGQGGPRRLLLSIAAGSPRVHFIDAARENPAAPPMFCMLLRKHVQGAKIAAVSQPAGSASRSWPFHRRCNRHRCRPAPPWHPLP